MDVVWYFTYGSNLDPERFRARVGMWRERRAAVLPDHELRFSGDVQSEGGGGAVIVPRAGGRVYGAALLIGSDQLAAMDAVELDPERNTGGLGQRRTVEILAEDERLAAEIYLLGRVTTFRAPSERYLGHVLRGLTAVGWPDEVVEAVRARAATEPD